MSFSHFRRADEYHSFWTFELMQYYVKVLFAYYCILGFVLTSMYMTVHTKFHSFIIVMIPSHSKTKVFSPKTLSTSSRPILNRKTFQAYLRALVELIIEQVVYSVPLLLYPLQCSLGLRGLGCVCSQYLTTYFLEVCQPGGVGI